jgi:hypothetical protein
MILKIFKAVWFISLLAVMANLLYIYAGLPEQVGIYEDKGEVILISREYFFYGAMLCTGMFNILVYLFSKNITPNETFRSWLHGQIITLNLFLIIVQSFIGLYNSAERFDYTRIGPIIYGSILLVTAWAAAWPFIWLWKRLLVKQ